MRWRTPFSRVAAGSRQQKVDDVSEEKPKLFVIMQFSAPFNELYSDVILPVGTDAGFAVVRADEIYAPGLIIDDIERQIHEAKATIATSPR